MVERSENHRSHRKNGTRPSGAAEPCAVIPAPHPGRNRCGCGFRWFSLADSLHHRLISRVPPGRQARLAFRGEDDAWMFCWRGNKWSMSLAHEFKDRAEVLTDADFQEVTGRLISLLEWMESQPTICEILNNLRSSGTGLKLLQQGSYHSPPKANTGEEIASVGLALIEACREHKTDLFQIAFGRGIQARGGGSDVAPHSDEAMRRYIVPFLN